MITSSSSLPVPGLPTQSVKVPPRFRWGQHNGYNRQMWRGTHINRDSDTGHRVRRDFFSGGRK